MRRLAASLIFSCAALACGESPVEVGSTALASVTPTADAVGVAVDARIEVRFGAPVAAGGGHPIALQVGACPGPVVAGSWERSSDGLALRFTPAQPLAPGSLYTIHVGGGLTDADAATIDFGPGEALGGSWVTLEMVRGMPSMGMGMGVAHDGPAWRHPNGLYGMSFSFTTGS